MINESKSSEKADPPSPNRSRILLLVILGVIVAAFAAFLIARPAMPPNTSSRPASSAK